MLLKKKASGVFKPVDSGDVPVDAAGAFAALSDRPGSGKCKVQASYPVKNPTVKASDAFNC